MIRTVDVRDSVERVPFGSWDDVELPCSVSPAHLCASFSRGSDLRMGNTLAAALKV